MLSHHPIHQCHQQSLDALLLSRFSFSLFRPEFSILSDFSLLWAMSQVLMFRCLNLKFSPILRPSILLHLLLISISHIFYVELHLIYLLSFIYPEIIFFNRSHNTVICMHIILCTSVLYDLPASIRYDLATYVLNYS